MSNSEINSLRNGAEWYVRDWFRKFYGAAETLLSVEKDKDWTIIDASELTQEKLKQFVEGAKRVFR